MNDPTAPSAEASQAAGSLELTLVHDPRVNLAMQQNDVPAIKQVRLRNAGLRAVEDLAVRLWAEPDLAPAVEVRVARVEPGSDHLVAGLELALSPERLFGLRERIKGTLHAEVRSAAGDRGAWEGPLELLAPSEWGGTASLPEILAAFVQPNHPAVQGLLGRAVALLGQGSALPALEGYQAKDPARARAQAAALYEALAQAEVAYVNPPASFERQGQKIRTPDQVMGDKLGTCLDLAVLYAAGLEQAGLNALVVLVEGHALAGFWLRDETFPQAAVLDDPSLLRKRVEVGSLVCVETTGVTLGSRLSFDQAVEAAGRRLAEPGGVFCAVDVRAARAAGIRPVTPRVSDEAGARPAAPLPPRPPAPGAAPAPAADGRRPGPERGEARAEAEPAPRRLLAWKERLLDLSLRNPLISFRPGKGAVPLLAPSVSGLEDALAEGLAFALHPEPAVMGKDDPRSAALHAERTGADARALFLEEEFARGRLCAGLPRDDLDRRLVGLYRSARSSLEESGANTLYLALGVLRWYESPSAQEPRRAPLVLLGVNLERRSVKDPCVLTQSDEEPRLNLALLRKLHAEYGAEVVGLDPLPVDDKGLDVPAVFKAFRDATLSLPRFEVVEEVWLAHFSFTKYLMWRDLEVRASDLMRSEVVRHLVERPGEGFPQRGTFPNPRSFDQTRPSRDVLCPLDADSSQLRAVFAAQNGQTFVLEGPPGTGKSQTIANLIAQCLAHEKTVLFVAEKRAALDVVHRRLSAVGLAPFCLELHSNKIQKQLVAEQLRAALDVAGEAPPAGFEDVAARLDEAREQLNRTVGALHQVRALGLSAFEAASRAVALRAAPRVPFAVGPAAELDRARADAWRAAAAALQAAALAAGPPAEHPFRATRPARWEPALGREAGEAVVGLRASALALAEALAGAAPLLVASADGAPRARVAALAALASLLLRSPTPPSALLADPEPDASSARLRAWVDKGRRRDGLAELLGLRYDVERLLVLDLPALREAFARWAASFAPLRWAMLLGPRGRLSSALRPGMELPSAAEAQRDLEAAMELYQLRQHFALAAPEAERLLGARWAGGRVAWDDVEALVTWLGELRPALAAAAGADPERLTALRERTHLLAREPALLAAGTPDGEGLRRLAAAWRAFEEARGRVGRALAPEEDAAYAPPAAPGFLEAVVARCGAWLDRAPDLREWCLLGEAAEAARGAGLPALVDELFAGRLPPGEVAAALERTLLETWLEGLCGAEDVLRSFRAQDQVDRVARFRALDEQARDLGARVARARLAARVPSSEAPAAEDSEMGVLQRELKKQRRQRSVRWLLGKLPHLLPRLKPCLLMSPLSVAQFLDPAHPPFDLVVFDEASQIPVWDAVGALARGRQAVVVGDSRQLPPTSFFQRLEADSPGTEDDLEDLESVLDECVACGLPRMALEWHYRSRHESLIAFSNARYYDGRLQTFPAAAREATDLGVSWRPVPEGVYDRAGSRTNRAEAEAVVAEVVRRFRDPAHEGRSIGVVTFSLPQQTLIEDLLDQARSGDPSLERFFGDEVPEPLFVKNLENVQGDERDVMLFSVCYGPDARGAVAMNFGPLNRPGGERRLNVAVTRARERLIVFSTLLPEQVDLARTSAVGVAHLRAFLDYAARGAAASGEAASGGGPGAPDLPPGDQPASLGLEDAVARAVEARGLQAHRRVGCSGYRLDLAVLDPKAPGRYLLGIEVDGAGWRAAPTARDRDRLRGAVLARLGWRLHRAFALEWWSGEARERGRLEAALDEAARAREVSDALAAETAEADRARAVAAAAASAAERAATEAAEAAATALVQARARASGVQPYEAWRPAAPPAAAAAFHGAAANRALLAALDDLLAREAPVAMEVVSRRLAAACGLGRVTDKVRRRVEDLVLLLPPDRHPLRQGAWLWAAGQVPDAYLGWRVPAEGVDPPRDPEQVPPEEAANAARAALEGAVALPMDSLVRETARLLGFSRSGAKGREAAERGVRLLLERGRGRLDGATVRLP